MKVLSLNGTHFPLSSGRLGMELWDRAAWFWHPSGESNFTEGAPGPLPVLLHPFRGIHGQGVTAMVHVKGLWGCSPTGRAWIQPARAHLRVLMPACSSAACDLERDRPGKCCSWDVGNPFPRQEAVNEGRRRQSFC